MTLLKEHHEAYIEAKVYPRWRCLIEHMGLMPMYHGTSGSMSATALIDRTAQYSHCVGVFPCGSI